MHRRGLLLIIKHCNVNNSNISKLNIQWINLSWCIGWKYTDPDNFFMLQWKLVSHGLTTDLGYTDLDGIRQKFNLVTSSQQCL